MIITEDETWHQRCQTMAKSIAEENSGRMDVTNRKVTFHGLPSTTKNELKIIQDAAAVYTYQCLALACASIDHTEL